MARSVSSVAQQLHSVALRYCHSFVHDAPDGGVLGWRGRLEEPVNLLRHPAGSPGRRDERLRRLEAILFLAREPLSSRRLCQYANLADATEARTLVRHLNEALDANGRAFRVEEVAGGFQLLTRPKFATWLRRLASVPKELRLSAPALETLSVIAYRQPAGRAEIEAVRGVNCGEIVRQLLERDLVRIAGRSDDLGRPYLYATTRRFLQLFGLRTLEDLPRAEQLRKQDPHSSNHSIQTRTNSESSDRNEEDFEVTATIRAELSPEELRKIRPGGIPGVLPRASDEEELDEEAEDEEDDDLDDLDDDDDDEDFDDDDEDDEFDEVDDEEGFEEEEWEEVDDEEDDDELDDDEDDDDDWDDDDDEEEEEEEEEWE